MKFLVNKYGKYYESNNVKVRHHCTTKRCRMLCSLSSRPFGYEQKEYSFAKSWGWDQRWTCLFISGLLQWSNSLFRGWEICFLSLGRENGVFPTRTLVGKTLFSTPRVRKQNFLPPKVYFWSNGHEIQILYLCRKRSSILAIISTYYYSLFDNDLAE